MICFKSSLRSSLLTPGRLKQVASPPGPHQLCPGPQRHLCAGLSSTGRTKHNCRTKILVGPTWREQRSWLSLFSLAPSCSSLVGKPALNYYQNKHLLSKSRYSCSLQDQKLAVLENFSPEDIGLLLASEIIHVFWVVLLFLVNYSKSKKS